MSILRNMSNLLIGKTNTTQAETAQMLAARMQSSSKLNLKDSDITPLSADPMSFNYHHYPQEVGQLGDGHYIEFQIFENTKSKLTTDKDGNPVKFGGVKGTAATLVTDEVKQQLTNATGKVIEQGQKFLDSSYSELGQSVKDLFTFDTKPTNADIEGYKKLFSEGPRNKFESTHSKLKRAIVLYTPPENKFKYSAEYDNAETGLLGGLVGSDSLLDVAGSATLAGLSKLTLSALEMVSPGVGGLATRATGLAINPNMELAFKSVPFRDFSYNFTFAPKNEEELIQTHKIIEAFKFHMLPALTQDQLFMVTPSQFQITYMYRGKQNTYIPRITKCVLTDMELDYAPNEKFTTLKPDDQGASPQIINMQLQFKEIAIVTKETVAGGY